MYSSKELDCHPMKLNFIQNKHLTKNISECFENWYLKVRTICSFQNIFTAYKGSEYEYRYFQRHMHTFLAYNANQSRGSDHYIINGMLIAESEIDNIFSKSLKLPFMHLISYGLPGVSFQKYSARLHISNNGQTFFSAQQIQLQSCYAGGYTLNVLTSLRRVLPSSIQTSSMVCIFKGYVIF